MRDPPERRELLGASAAPRGGIITCWSQPSSAPSSPRSLISASRRRSSSNARDSRQRTVYHALNGLRRARRGSSEDDLPLRVSHASNVAMDGVRSSPNDRGARQLLSMESRRLVALEQLQNGRHSAFGEAHDLGQAAVRRGLGDRRASLRGQLAQRGGRVAQPQHGDLASFGGSASRPSARIASSCRCAAAAVRSRFASSAFARRFASARVAATTACSSSRRASRPRRRPRAGRRSPRRPSRRRPRVCGARPP